MRRSLAGAGVMLLLLVGTALPAAQTDRKRAAEDLRAVTERIERVKRQVQQDAVEKDRLSRDLREAERTVSRAQGDLSKLRAQRIERSTARRALVAEKERRELEREKTQSELADQMRAAYFMGRNEPLKLLLNQRNPAQFGRNLTYYGYFGRQRADQIGLISKNIATIEELTTRIDEEDAELARLESEQKSRVGELDSARRQRGRVLASLEKESSGRAASLKRLQTQAEQLDRLLKELNRATESVPFDPNDPFSRLRGKLSWPVAGRLVVAFGQASAGDLRSNGIEIDTDRGTNVRAVHDGLVVYSDWMSGRGLLIIVKHSDGYMSVYGHNEQLLKTAGTRVAAGEAIATAGDSGGRKRPGLYFEIRRGGKPVDPKGWFRSGSPPAE